jgi:hypothetical protein
LALLTSLGSLASLAETVPRGSAAAAKVATDRAQANANIIAKILIVVLTK